jgi:hypothetical protein
MGSISTLMAIRVVAARLIAPAARMASTEPARDFFMVRFSHELRF